ncbi:hypothetical protein IMG5_171750 [Ichthyophthirius multifiliis]|uniref:Exonuclease 1 n=1 Tax=Ichthyophthirius multifiliis TaxID=5932 RepID=G0R1N6_ICHMU|nr:hypothetical protein IMG5_171750 [Ichthyophthirius multifiliis]EGR28613.1 hypothetical protein IMG5_171750 [Ichthyophthirius multifiliis]|eukprot:XP_004029849.1 hypothetical protein IMG5_171750 [Ichthyophthirius multifiliis]
MGIEGLSQLIKPILEKKYLSQLNIKSVAVDAMYFLYKGCYACSYQLNNNIETKEYMIYLFKIIKLLQFYKIEPIIVFDGRSLPAKDLTHKQRENTKQKNLDIANKLIEEGKKQESFKYFSRCLRVNKKMIYEVIDTLFHNKIKFVISPYEADAQIAFMVRKGITDAAVTEDSDLICYGCPRVIFKLKLDGSCEYLDLNKYTENQALRKTIQCESLRCFLAQSENNRILICIMAGSDYIPSIHGIGIKKAIDLFYRLNNFQSVMRKLRVELKFDIPQKYEEMVQKVSLIFKHQLVFDFQEKILTYINELGSDFKKEDLRQIGIKIEYFEEVCQGLRDVYSLEKRQIKESKLDLQKQYLNYNSIKKNYDQYKQYNNNENNSFCKNKQEKIIKNKDEILINNKEKNNDEKSSENQLFENIENYNFSEDEENLKEIQIQEKQNVNFFKKIKAENQDKNALFSLESFCDAFLNDYKQLENANEDFCVRIQQEIKRNENKEELQKSVIKINPFIKQNTINTSPLDSLEAFNVEKIPRQQSSAKPEKRVLINNQKFNKSQQENVKSVQKEKNKKNLYSSFFKN